MPGRFTRTFTAVDIPDGIKGEMHRIDLQGLARTIGMEQLHITLNFLGSLTEGELAKAINSVSAYKHAGFEVHVAGMGMFEHRDGGIVYVSISEGAKELGEVHSQLHALLTKEGLSDDAKDYVPHITVARFKKLGGAETMRLRSIVSGMESAEFGRFRCNGIELKKSVLDSNGPSYYTLTRSDLA